MGDCHNVPPLERSRAFNSQSWPRTSFSSNMPMRSKVDLRQQPYIKVSAGPWYRGSRNLAPPVAKGVWKASAIACAMYPSARVKAGPPTLSALVSIEHFDAGTHVVGGVGRVGVHADDDLSTGFANRPIQPRGSDFFGIVKDPDGRKSAFEFVEDEPRPIVAHAIGNQDFHFGSGQVPGEARNRGTRGCTEFHSGRGQPPRHESLGFAAWTIPFPQADLASQKRNFSGTKSFFSRKIAF